MAQKDSNKEEGMARGGPDKKGGPGTGKGEVRKDASKGKKEQTPEQEHSAVILMGAASSRKELQSGVKETASQLDFPKQKGSQTGSKEEGRAQAVAGAPAEKRSNLGKPYFGFLVLFAGLLLIANGMGLLGPLSVHYTALWPLLIITAGLSLFSVTYRTSGARTISTILILLVFIVSAALLLKNGNVFTVNTTGMSTQETRNVEPFNRIVFQGNGSVTLVQSDKTNVSVSADENVIGEVVTTSDGKTLTIAYKRPFWNAFLFEDARVDVTVGSPTIENVQLSGAGAIKGSGIRTQSLDIALEGTGTITLDGVQTDLLTTRLSGTGDITIAGNTGRELVYIIGTGTYHGESLMSDEAGIRISGSGDAYVHAEKELNASVSGIGDVLYTGTPVISNDSVTGSGSVRSIGESGR